MEKGNISKLQSICTGKHKVNLSKHITYDYLGNNVVDK